MLDNLQPHLDPQRVDTCYAQARTGDACGRVGGVVGRGVTGRGSVAEKRSVMIQSLQRLTAVLALLLSLLAPAHASAMLDPGLGRFTQRDPHPDTYPDGMNAYAGYHVLWGGVDPSGMGTATNPAGQLALLKELMAAGQMTLAEAAAALSMTSSQAAGILLTGGVITIDQLFNDGKYAAVAFATVEGLAAGIRSEAEKLGDWTAKAMQRTKCQCMCSLYAATGLPKVIKAFGPDPNWPKLGMVFFSQYAAAAHEKSVGRAAHKAYLDAARAKVGMGPLANAPQHLKEVKDLCNGIKNDYDKAVACMKDFSGTCTKPEKLFTEAAIEVLKAANAACSKL